MNLTITIDTRALRVAAVALAGAAVLGLTAVMSASPSPVAGGLIHSCYLTVANPGNTPALGSVRIAKATEACKPNETALDWNAQGIKGDKGDKGDTGAQGPQGPQGPAGVSTLTMREQSFPVTAGDKASGLVRCNPGERATSGGFALGTDSVQVNSSSPYPPFAPSTPEGWFVAVTHHGSTNSNFFVRVVCAAG
jgi:hypothetical protein